MTSDSESDSESVVSRSLGTVLHRVTVQPCDGQVLCRYGSSASATVTAFDPRIASKIPVVEAVNVTKETEFRPRMCPAHTCARVVIDDVYVVCRRFARVSSRRAVGFYSVADGAVSAGPSMPKNRRAACSKRPMPPRQPPPSIGSCAGSKHARVLDHHHHRAPPRRRRPRKHCSGPQRTCRAGAA